MLGVSKKKRLSGKKWKIIVAEDDPSGRNLIKLVLANMKIENVTYVSDGLSAWQEIEKAELDESPYDLVISDWNMPIATGIELLEQMRDDDVKTPFLMITGRGLSESAVEAKILGVSAFMSKPYSPQNMIRKIDELLNQKWAP